MHVWEQWVSRSDERQCKLFDEYDVAKSHNLMIKSLYQFNSFIREIKILYVINHLEK